MKFRFLAFIFQSNDKGIESLPQTENYHPYICSTQCRRSSIFQTMNSVRPKSLSLKYQRFTPSDFKEIGIRKFEFVAKTQFLCLIYSC